MMDNYFVLAKILHILGVVIWIGGVAFVTTVLIPAIRKTQAPKDRLQLFEVLEGKFSFQAKFTTLLTGLTGFYMLHVMGIGLNGGFWNHLMILVWAVFTLVLFVLEPLFLHKWFHQQATNNNEKAFLVLQVMHVVLLSISLLAIFFAMAGAHGFVF